MQKPSLCYPKYEKSTERRDKGLWAYMLAESYRKHFKSTLPLTGTKKHKNPALERIRSHLCKTLKQNSLQRSR